MGKEVWEAIKGKINSDNIGSLRTLLTALFKKGMGKEVWEAIKGKINAGNIDSLKDLS